ncbi:MAG TPA: amidase [Caulobacteraceae bacterium]|nr:amidase [Caulobacteraceae bacterium]
MILDRRALLATAAALPAASCAERLPWARPSDELAWLDATATADLIRRKQLAPSEAVEAAIRRAEALNPQLNFLVTTDFDRARARAAVPASGPFQGVPTLIKDLQDVEGIATRSGSRATARAPIPKATHPNVGALLSAGLISLGKSSTPEYGFLPTTEPIAFGPTRNPWDPSRSSGGSSGGAAAAVAAGVVPIAHASDGGGSIRIPASNCGLFGMKPSRGRMAGDPADADELSVKFAVSRSVRDSAALFAAMEKTDFPGRPVGVVTAPGKRRLRIGWITDNLTGGRPEPEVRAGVEATLRLLQDLGHKVEEARWPFSGREVGDDFRTVWSSYAAGLVQILSKHMGGVPDERTLEPFTLGLARGYAGLPAGALDAAGKRLSQAARAYAAMFQTYDVLLTPVLAAPPAPLGYVDGDESADAVWAKLETYAPYTPIQNLAGTPAMSVPLHWTRDGLPVGMHFAAGPAGERTLFELAYELERARPWSRRRPKVSA